MDIRRALHEMGIRIRIIDWRARKRVKKLRYSLPHRPLTFDSPQYLLLDKEQILVCERMGGSSDLFLAIIQDAKRNLRRYRTTGPVPVIMPDTLMQDIRANLEEMMEYYSSVMNETPVSTDSEKTIVEAEEKHRRCRHAFDGLESRPLASAVYHAVYDEQ